MTKYLTMGSYCTVREEKGWFNEIVYQLSRIEQGHPSRIGTLCHKSMIYLINFKAIKYFQGLACSLAIIK